jgi:hypothetical protein
MSYRLVIGSTGIVGEAARPIPRVLEPHLRRLRIYSYQPRFIGSASSGRAARVITRIPAEVTTRRTSARSDVVVECVRREYHYIPTTICCNPHRHRTERSRTRRLRPEHGLVQSRLVKVQRIYIVLIARSSSEVGE